MYKTWAKNSINRHNTNYFINLKQVNQRDLCNIQQTAAVGYAKFDNCAPKFNVFRAISGIKTFSRDFINSIQSFYSKISIVFVFLPSLFELTTSKQLIFVNAIFTCFLGRTQLKFLGRTTLNKTLRHFRALPLTVLTTRRHGSQAWISEIAIIIQI